ncbi:MAG: hypothetical protein LBL65_02880 [Campylobacteraceae bacterium]|jgi:hypothetical protein|nr:hypothetical protein [Campylobacteraceae bacterium]
MRILISPIDIFKKLFSICIITLSLLSPTIADNLGINAGNGGNAMGSSVQNWESITIDLEPDEEFDNAYINGGMAVRV